MRANKRTFLSLLLAFCMLFSMVPSMTAGAVEDDAEEVTTEVVESTTEEVAEEKAAEDAVDVTEMKYLEGVTATPDAEGLPDNDELFAYWMQEQLYGGIAPCADYGEKVLNSSSLAFYNELRSYIEIIAKGDRASTIIEWPEYFIGTWTYQEIKDRYGITLTPNSSQDDIRTAVGAVASEIIECLLVDCPYDLYWYDKTYGCAYRFGYLPQENDIVIGFSEIDFVVAQAYQNGNEYTVDTTKAKATTTAAANANAVVAQNAGKSDYEKLLAYQAYICAAVEYNFPVIEETNPAYGDPWQMIWVFDGDPTTKVVCEGYSKAFQYLCDKSTFTNNIVCYTVTGGLGVVDGNGAFLQTPGPHMWNIVTMEDGKNYLVDVTNSDDGDTPAEILFLAGTDTRKGYDEYTFRQPTYANSNGIYFKYDTETMSLYPESILTLSRTYYCAHPSQYLVTTRENEKAPDCEHDGSYDEVVTCDRCGAEVSRTTKTVPALGHNWGEWKVTKEGSCTEKGEETRTCATCGATETRETESFGHKWGEWQVTTAPTCTEKGVETRTCNACGAKETNELAALGHAYGEWTVTKEATCTEDGERVSTCSRCQEKVTEVIPALGHDYKVVTEGKDATCTEDGVEPVETCTRCGDTKGGKVIPALGHDYQVTKAEKKPTCTEDGNTKETTCSRCNDVQGGEVLPALGHDYKVTKKAKDPTCTEDGNTEETTCSRCNDVQGGEVLPALGHKVEKWETTKEPTCTEAGTEEDVCTVCDETVTREIAALGHDYKVTEEAVDPTCKEDGKTAVETCSRCGDEKGGEVVPAGHKWDDGKVSKEPTTTEEGEKTYTCEVCGETKTETIPVVEKPADPAKPNNQQNDNGAPKTGDNNVVMMWMLLLVASGACVAGVASKRRNGCR